MSNIVLKTSISALLLPTLAVANVPSVVLDDEVITATRTPTKTSNAIAQTLVIDSQKLAHYQSQSVLDVLKTQAGFSSYGSGGSDKLSNIYLRGYDGKNILILIDGIRYGSVSTGTVALGQLPINHIERIEILQGATGSALYGADASGGVVQVFTKKGNIDGSRLALTVGVGSHDELNYGVSTGYANEHTKINLSASHRETDGFNAIALPFVDSQRDEDGFDTDNFSASFSHDFGRVEVGASLLGSKSTTHYDDTWASTPDIYVNSKNGSANAYISTNYSTNGTIRLSHGQSIDKTTNHAGNVATSTFDTTQKQTNLTINHTLAIGNIVAGAEYLQQQLDSDTNYQNNARTNKSLFAGYQATHHNLDGQVFVRHDKTSAFGNKTTYNAGLAYRITPALRVGASHATGFRAPTFNELYYPIQWGSGGNPNLKAETSKNTEAFIEYKGDHHLSRLTGYKNNIKDMIVGWTPRNADKAKITGVSLTSDWQFGNYLVGVNYDYQEANDITDNKKLDLPIRPNHKGGAYVGYAHENFDIKAEYQRVGSYYHSANHANKIEGYGLVNVSGTYQLTPHISLTHRINNLFDKKYVTNATQGMFGTTYHEDGINFQTAITFSY